MGGMAPEQMANKVAQGLLSFPVTHFDSEGRFDETPYRRHCDYLLSFKRLAGLFAAGGTGEFFSLTPQEIPRVVEAAVKETAGRTPVIAGAGYGTETAVELARDAERAGADGILLLPPYLMVPSQEGLAAHVDAVCRATGLGVIVYNRDNAVITEDTLARLCERNPNLVGFKDGVGDLELMMRVFATMGDRLTYIGGLPTAETFALPYLEMGVTTYSSAIYNFMPEWALSFYDAVRARDRVAVMRGLKDFVLPYIKLRNRNKGYAVSIIKAGMAAVGQPAGPVRLPLTELTAGEAGELRNLIAAVQPKLVSEKKSRIA